MFLMKIVLSQLCGVESIVFISLEYPDVPDGVIYDERYFEFEKFMPKTGAPKYKEV